MASARRLLRLAAVNLDRYAAPDVTPRDRTIDAVLTVSFATFTVLPYVGMAAQRSDSLDAWLWMLASCMMVAPLMLRRSYPMVMLAAMGLAGIFQVVVAPYPLASIMVVPIAVFSVARWVPSRDSRWAVWLGILGSVLGPARWAGTIGGAEFIVHFVFAAAFTFVCLGLVTTSYLIGRRVREDALTRETTARMKAHQQRLALIEREERSRTAEANARNQIARELHDIVAHSLSVIVVQAEGGRAMAVKKPEAAAEVLDTIADTSREALGDLRRIVGVLRNPSGESEEYAPTPGLEDIREMVARTGSRILLIEKGTPPAHVSPALGLTAYRVVQESITNMLKHAGPQATAEVRVSYLPHCLDIVVVDNGRGKAAEGDGMGNGLQGMRERVGAMGGRLSARPGDTHGYRVHAVLPWGPTGSPSSASRRAAANPVPRPAPAARPAPTPAASDRTPTGAPAGPVTPAPSATGLPKQPVLPKRRTASTDSQPSFH
ncbi:sensor histidine kinase [Parenemella sanctibonifatiensis]|uniref:histidine kinase n=1 Tax=Parenemella sanctibonifatiensis TaxID=2016505 RepID=A0A255EFL5_9ACTN|nr:sensor histidine kinase [Parenemella sanctibonifatiensis]